MDYIANIITKVKNASCAGDKTVTFAYSTVGEAISETLAKAGFIGTYAKKGKKNKNIELTLLFDGDNPKISGAKKISSHSKRVYVNSKNIKPVRNGYGKVIVSTPKGVMTGEDAVKAGVGGELLFEIW